MCELLKHLFNLLIENGVFPDYVNIARVTPIYKGEDSSDVNNYRPISMLPCFSKVLERIIYNLLFKYLVKNNILYSKKCYFQNVHSTDNAVAQLVDQIIESFFKKNEYKLGVFFDLWHGRLPFDTVYHSILIKNWSYKV